ncbi:hypothetical protein FF38_11980 [Lucilia cuprina]|uniref:Uncharacterized protein n=1 Tax=Lucilia cuprina TaxID=7375 RepID=A0A0L0CED0_LUCCU|nr:hypothetical protein FF38_11980 [Lucilia cuprina]
MASFVSSVKAISSANAALPTGAHCTIIKGLIILLPLQLPLKCLATNLPCSTSSKLMPFEGPPLPLPLPSLFVPSSEPLTMKHCWVMRRVKQRLSITAFKNEKNLRSVFNHSPTEFARTSIVQQLWSETSYSLKKLIKNIAQVASTFLFITHCNHKEESHHYDFAGAGRAG